jgi:MFS family permease
MGMLQPSINSLISREAGPQEQGSIMGAAQSIGSLARVLGPGFAGLVFDLLGRHAPYIIGAVLMVVVAVLAARLVRQADQAGGPAPAAAGDGNARTQPS